MIAQVEFQIAPFLEATLEKSGDLGLCIGPRRRPDECLIRAPAIGFRRDAGPSVDKFFCKLEGSRIEARDASRKPIDERVQLGVGDRSVHPAISFRGLGIEIFGAADDLERTRATG